MNGNFFSNPTFPTNVTNPDTETTTINESINLSQEQNYIENILKRNKGKKIKAYYSYPDSTEWQNKIYDGILESVGSDYLIMSEPKTGEWHLLRMIYLNYITFEEKINE